MRVCIPLENIKILIFPNYIAELPLHSAFLFFAGVYIKKYKLLFVSRARGLRRVRRQAKRDESAGI